MSLILEAGQPCPHGSRCPYNKDNECMGAKAERNVRFNCSYVKNGQIVEGGSRNRYDQTGNMKIIME